MNSYHSNAIPLGNRQPGILDADTTKVSDSPRTRPRSVNRGHSRRAVLERRRPILLFVPGGDTARPAARCGTRRWPDQTARSRSSLARWAADPAVRRRAPRWAGSPTPPSDTSAGTSGADSAPLPAPSPSHLIVLHTRRPISNFGTVPGNPLQAEPFHPVKYIERLDTGSGDTILRSRRVGLPEPGFALTDGFVITLGRLSHLRPPRRRRPAAREATAGAPRAARRSALPAPGSWGTLGGQHPRQAEWRLVLCPSKT
jgi:hypothetical protein